ncbi:MAG: hypothetical protein GWN01_02145 [Nitrosopumilaceae archaeon]|nr:hypothetical protein [Nitrosopumilaceae archaeon]NIT99775.1 hypothetical protein [Nitrosopumilaceae archaeon]NIU88637.1 hypothetical protein [Nitrosopumilaceae archaeon]NIV64911.1 hypothetical protein [Nitrosopumilaceae archaeon]NIX60378.1 hypothetical protein [Nitrosopumilaceae archaeon]
MAQFHEFSNENYNSLKLFLVSKYNIRFLPGRENTHERLEIKDDDTVIGMTFYKDDTLEVISSNEENPVYREIIGKIKQSSQKKSSGAENKKNESYNQNYDDMLNLFLHISECDSCKEKFRIIFEHFKTS